MGCLGFSMVLSCFGGWLFDFVGMYECLFLTIMCCFFLVSFELGDVAMVLLIGFLLFFLVLLKA